MKTFISYRLLVCLGLVLALVACSATIKPIKDINNNALMLIQQAYQETVNAAHRDDRLSWNNGRLGNIIVNVNGGANRGLCYHWQHLVYDGIQAALVKSGWKATGIAINEGSYYEHHAVLVYDPARLGLDNILRDNYLSLSYVLDPWSSGQARIYTTADWLKLPLTIKAPARLTRVTINHEDSRT